MRLEQFRYVVEIARCRSMSKAAKRLFLSQPALSTSISNLESELGFQVFQRSFQGVALTEKGEKFLEISRRIVEQLETIPAIAQDPKTAPVVNIAAVPAACNSLVIELIQQMRQDRPDTIINIQELRPTKVLRPLAEGEADLAIGIHIPSIRDEILRQVEQADLQIEEVFRDTMCVYLPKNHPLAKKKSISRQELAKDTPIFFSDYIRLDQNDANGEEIQSSRNYFSFTDQASMKKAISQGLGYAILPRQMEVDDIYISSGKIVARPLEGEETKLTTFLAYKRNISLSAEVKHALVLLRGLYCQLAEKQQRMLE